MGLYCGRIASLLKGHIGDGVFKGSIVALVTPFKDGSVDFPTLTKLLEWHLEQKTDAILIAGTTGESCTLTKQETIEAIQLAKSLCMGKVPVIAGAGSNSTQTTIENVKAFAAAGADACLLVTPYYNKPTQQGLYQHFKAVAAAVSVPHILYNVPSRTAVDLSNETVIELAKIPNIVGLKDATGDLSRVQKLTKLQNFSLLSGDDGTFLEYMQLGGHGVISVTSNIVPEMMAQICRLAKTDFAAASALNNKLLALHQKLFIESNPIPAKWALYCMHKLASAEARLPLTTLSEEKRPVLEEVLQQLNLNT